jgi:hypothetical protein
VVWQGSGLRAAPYADFLFMKDTDVSDENRIIDIEIKLADQENLVDALNRAALLSESW